MRKSEPRKPETNFNILPPAFNPFLMQATSKHDLNTLATRSFNVAGWNALIPPEISLSRPAWAVQNLPMYFPFFQLPLNDAGFRFKDSLQTAVNRKATIVNPCEIADNVSPAHRVTTTNKTPPRPKPEYARSCDRDDCRTVSLSSSRDYDVDNRQSPADSSTDRRDFDVETTTETPYLKFGVRAILSGKIEHEKQNISPTRANHEPPFRFHNHVTSPVNGDFRNQYFNHHYQLLNHSNHRPHCTARIGSHGSLYGGLTSPVLPWLPTSIRGKNRRGMLRRAVFTDTQRKSLEKKFQTQKYIGKPDRKRLAAKLGLKDSQVKIWFQNRRMKWRNSKEREMLQSVRNDVTTDESVTSSIGDVNVMTDDVIMQQSETGEEDL